MIVAASTSGVAVSIFAARGMRLAECGGAGERGKWWEHVSKINNCGEDRAGV